MGVPTSCNHQRVSRRGHVVPPSRTPVCGLHVTPPAASHRPLQLLHVVPSRWSECKPASSCAAHLPRSPVDTVRSDPALTTHHGSCLMLPSRHVLWVCHVPGGTLCSCQSVLDATPSAVALGRSLSPHHSQVTPGYAARCDCTCGLILSSRLRAWWPPHVPAHCAECIVITSVDLPNKSKLLITQHNTGSFMCFVRLIT